MTIDIPFRNTDDMSTVYTTNTPLFDAPIYDDMEGVIDDSDGHYESGISIEDMVLKELALEQKIREKAAKALRQELKNFLRSVRHETESKIHTD
jgi:hypothetical protein